MDVGLYARNLTFSAEALFLDVSVGVESLASPAMYHRITSPTATVANANHSPLILCPYPKYGMCCCTDVSRATAIL